MTKNEIQPREFQKTTSEILSYTRKKIAEGLEGLTGMAVSKREDWAFSVGHIFQQLMNGQFLSTLKQEWDQYKKKGRIKNDYQQTGQHKACLQELLDSLDKDLLNDDRFSVLKKIFLVAATEEISDRNSHLPLQFMQISRTLRTGEILVLYAVYKVAKGDDRSWKKNRLARPWLEKVAAESGLKHPELVEIHEEELIKKGLITDRTHRAQEDRIGITPGERFRLTGLGYDLCEYIEHYERQGVKNRDTCVPI